MGRNHLPRHPTQHSLEPSMESKKSPNALLTDLVSQNGEQDQNNLCLEVTQSLPHPVLTGLYPACTTVLDLRRT